MIRSSSRMAYWMFAALALSLAVAGQASAQIASVSDAKVQNYFYSQQGPNGVQTDPTGLTFTPGPGGPWGVGGPTSLPGLGAPLPWSPTIPLAWSPNSFASGPYTSSFTDGNTSPVKSMGFVDISPTAIGGANVVDANVFLAMRLVNPSTQDAFHGMIFQANFFFNNQLLAGITTAPAMVVSGFSSTYAEFGGQIDFWEASANSAGVVGPFSLYRGSLNYYWNQLGGGFFGAIVNPTASGITATSSTTGGAIAAVGRFWVAGDPAEVNVNAVPEPGTILQALSGISGLGISAFVARRRKT